MSTDNSAANSPLADFFQFAIYKRNQGKVTRQTTFGAIAATVAFAAWRLHESQQGAEWFNSSRFVLPAVLLLAGWFVAFRLVNLPKFATFLIAVEAEMTKVSWPSKAELYRSSVVVIFVLFSLSGALFGFDVLWRLLFQLIGVVQ
ncbi:MAG: hypothetical protein RLY70_2085 [Planctomycetota bacterium]|jgi:preprotein translocase subunit SecE